MRLIDENKLLKALEAKGLLTEEVKRVCRDMRIYATTETAYPKIMIKARWNGEVRRVGEDPAHDWLKLVGNSLHFINMQCGQGTEFAFGYEGYDFEPTYVIDGNDYVPPEEFFTSSRVYEYIEGDQDEGDADEQREQLYKMLRGKKQ